MASKFYRKYYVPETFPELLKDFSREILREQPKDVVHFAVQFFRAIKEGVEFEYDENKILFEPVKPEEKEGSGSKDATEGKTSGDDDGKKDEKTSEVKDEDEAVGAEPIVDHREETEETEQEAESTTYKQ
eukprot:CAMPEP_0115008334 /NCGR_PEP_ID=MMETSP0216-20121206/21846_1 /TAXON_ID=223996 /ORGANISM="Protocruzia adherens, Strain Boccale" /LENGTH=129 /DNA_ID=CAMNT_0002375713 /DNA_START=42 /DNA_END=431 /DNA_ORIENTATION=-